MAPGVDIAAGINVTKRSAGADQNPVFSLNLSIALVHYPVVDKNGHTVTSAVTNLDVHDIARAAKTYGVGTFYVVTPLAEQKELVQRIVEHWVSGYGATYNPQRRRALALVKLMDSLTAVRKEILGAAGVAPRVIATSSRGRDNLLGFDACRQMLGEGTPALIVFGTAWGLEEGCIKEADYLLEPIVGTGNYNHLSVRSAVSIILDRLVRTPAVGAV